MFSRLLIINLQMMCESFTDEKQQQQQQEHCLSHDFSSFYLINQVFARTLCVSPSR